MDEDGLIGGCLTPPGEGGLLVFRLAGPRLPRLLDRIFRPASNGSAVRRRLRYGHLMDGDEVVDEVLLLTEERGRTAEISTHGGLGTQAVVEDLLQRRGVTLVDPEVVAEADRPPPVGSAVDREARRGLGRAWSVQAMLFYLEVLERRLVMEVAAIRNSIGNHRGAAASVLPSLTARLDSLVRRAPFGRAFGEPPSLVLVGGPNVGKSTLANRLLDVERCIVTPEPGTTRDLVVEDLTLEGYPFRIVDSAGIRGTDHVVEREGVARSLTAAGDADLVLLVLDGTLPLPTDPRIVEWLRAPRTLVCLNKLDLGLHRGADELQRRLGRPVFPLSALTGEGVDLLTEGILFRSPFRGPATREMPCPFTPRQDGLLRAAREALAEAPDEAAAALSLLLEGSS